MTFKQGLIAARSQIVFLLGLITAFGIIVFLEHKQTDNLSSREPAADRQHTAKPALWNPIAPPPSAPLTSQERQWGTIAWKYFENNLQSATGLVNSVDGYPASTMWDTASYLMALVSAQRLALLDRDTFDRRLTQALTSLARLPLFEERLPNKSYNTVSLAMVDYTNKPTEKGIGWSAIDIGRLLVPFNIIAWHYPAHTEEISTILSRWRFDRLLRDGVLYGAAIDERGETVYVQEGRLGYEEYAAKSFTLLGLDVFTALDYWDFTRFIEIEGAPVPTDSRAPEIYEAHNYVVSEPYILDGIEFGWDDTSRDFASRVYDAQYRRFLHLGIPTAVSEDNIDQPPYFVYNTVFTNGKAWNCIAESGADASAFRSLSTKAAFGWYALYRTPYTQQLIDRVDELFDPNRGWYSGAYEADGSPNKAITGNTNAIILEALAYKQFGKLVSFHAASPLPSAVNAAGAQR